MWALREEYGGARVGEEDSVWLVFPTHAEVRYRFFLPASDYISFRFLRLSVRGRLWYRCRVIIGTFHCSPGRTKASSLVVLRSLTLAGVWDVVSDASDASAITCFVDERKLSMDPPFALDGDPWPPSSGGFEMFVKTLSFHMHRAPFHLNPFAFI